MSLKKSRKKQLPRQRRQQPQLHQQLTQLQLVTTTTVIIIRQLNSKLISSPMIVMGITIGNTDRVERIPAMDLHPTVNGMAITALTIEMIPLI